MNSGSRLFRFSTLFLSIGLVASLTALSCNDRRSEGKKPEVVDAKEVLQAARQVTVQVGEDEHVMPVEEFKGGIVPDERKAQKLVNQLYNYTLAVCSSKRACPETAEAAKDALLDKYGLFWPDDPWGKPYSYKLISKQKFEIRSFGPDGIEGNADDVTVAAINIDN